MPIVLEAMVQKEKITHDQLRHISKAMLYNPEQHAFEGGTHPGREDILTRPLNLSPKPGKQPKFHEDPLVHAAISRGIELGLVGTKYREIRKGKAVEGKRMPSSVFINPNWEQDFKAYALKHGFVR